MQQSHNKSRTRLGKTVCIAIVAVFFVPFMVAMANAQGCPPNLISYWKLDDAMGFVATDSFDGNDGTLVNGPVWTDPGQVNGALSFDGVDDYVGTTMTADISGTQLSLEAWVNPTGDAPNQHIISKWNWPQGPGRLSYVLVTETFTGGRGTRLVIKTTQGIFEQEDGIALPKNQWSHLVGTYDGAKNDLYINGVLVASLPAFGNLLLSPTIPVWLGAMFNNRDHFKGTIDEAAIYNRALSPDEIWEHYQNGLNNLGYCPTTLACVGFGAPLNAGPVTVKKKRALPFKAQLLDENQMAVTDTDLASPPVMQIIFSPASGDDPMDVTGDALAVGLGTEGNQFEFNVDQWQYNLKTSNYSAPGTYTATMITGNSYLVTPTCEASFVIK